MQFVSSSQYLHSYRATHIHMVSLNGLQVVFQTNSRCAWTWWSIEVRDTLQGNYHVKMAMHLRAMIEWVWSSIGNGWGEPASGPGLDHINRLVWLQNRLLTQSPAYWWAKHCQVPVNPGSLLGSIRPVGSNHWFWFSGFCIYGYIQISYR